MVRPNEAQEDLQKRNSSCSDQQIKPSDGECLDSEGGVLRELQ